MRHEYVCGAVLYTVTPSGIRYVLVIEKEGHCGLPKGHIEPGETETQTALREIREETGITARIIDGFRLEVSYQKGSCLQKHLTCFLAAYDNQYTPSHTAEVRTFCSFLMWKPMRHCPIQRLKNFWKKPINFC